MELSMHIQILGCSGSRYPGEHSPAFLIDRQLLLDAGTVCGSLNAEEQAQIESVLITHSHLDHVMGLASLADNLLLSGSGKGISVYGSDEVLGIVKKHLFNGLIWPDFGVIPQSASPVIRWEILEPRQNRNICGYQVTPVPVSHSVPAVGYLITSESSRLLFTGDTGPTDSIWQFARDLTLLIVEVSFPNSLEELALRTGHLTPELLKRELHKLPNAPRQIAIMHLKSVYREQIITELAQLDISPIEVMTDNSCYEC